MRANSPAGSGEDVASDFPEQYAPLVSLGRNSTARLASDLAQLPVGLIGAVITARWLGPAGKGSLSTLLLLTTLLTYACSAGLEDAAIVLYGQRRAKLQDALSGSIPVILATSVVGVAILWIAGGIADWSHILWAVTAASLLLPVAALSRICMAIENARERLIFTSGVSLVIALVTTVGYGVFIIGLDLGVTGGAVAALLGGVVGFFLIVRRMHRDGMSLDLHWLPTYLRPALRFGLRSQFAYLLVAMSQRLDVLLVYWLAGEAPAGIYSIALTIGQLVWYAPFALTSAGFPRLAQLDEIESTKLLQRMSRVGLASTLVSAGVLFMCIPILVPWVFGRAFAEAVAPSMLLVGGGILWSQQWLLGRAAAARGDVGHYLTSFSISLFLMTGLDLLLIPSRGILGAALGSVVGPAGGLAFSACVYANRRGWRWIAGLRPGLRDVTFLFDHALSVSRAVWLLLVNRGRMGDSTDEDLR